MAEAVEASGLDSGGDDAAPVGQQAVASVGVGGCVDVDNLVAGRDIGEVETGTVVVQASDDQVDLAELACCVIAVAEVMADVGHGGVREEGADELFGEVGLVGADVVRPGGDDAVEAVVVDAVTVDEGVAADAEVGQLLCDVAAESAEPDDSEVGSGEGANVEWPDIDKHPRIEQLESEIAAMRVDAARARNQAADAANLVIDCILAHDPGSDDGMTDKERLEDLDSGLSDLELELARRIMTGETSDDGYDVKDMTKWRNEGVKDLAREERRQAARRRFGLPLNEQQPAKRD